MTNPFKRGVKSVLGLVIIAMVVVVAVGFWVRTNKFTVTESKTQASLGYGGLGNDEEWQTHENASRDIAISYRYFPKGYTLSEKPAEKGFEYSYLLSLRENSPSPALLGERIELNVALNKENLSLLRWVKTTDFKAKGDKYVKTKINGDDAILFESETEEYLSKHIAVLASGVIYFWSGFYKDTAMIAEDVENFAHKVKFQSK
ncbi:MAG: hypothetical protein Q8P86_00895 [bacterium]|nr:hypothetical protein [bacterium]